jgi:hypothetical protein
MEAINPNDIAKLEKDEISFITFKNGNMIMVDESAPEKYQSKEIKNNDKNIRINNKDKDKNFQKLSISKKIIFNFEGKESNLNLENKNIYQRSNDINNQKMQKNDFNLISHISKIVDFSYKGNANKNIINNIPTLKLNNNIKDNMNNDQNKLDNLSSSNLSNCINTKNEEITEEEKIDMRIKRKSRNYLEQINSLIEEKNKQRANAVISLKIPADISREFTSTQQKFNSMLTLFKQKKSKYSSNNNDKSIYQKYYESYKNKDKNIKLLKQIHLNRIKYYEEAENENKDNYENKNDVLDKNKFNKNIFDNFNNNNTFFGEANSKENNDTLSTINKFTINSLNGKMTRASSEKRLINYKLGGSNIGYSSTLICPINIFKSKINSIL